MYSVENSKEEFLITLDASIRCKNVSCAILTLIAKMLSCWKRKNPTGNNYYKFLRSQEFLLFYCHAQL